MFGGGKEGLRRAEQLLAEGAAVEVYSLCFGQEWQGSKAICHTMPYHSSLLKNAFLVAAATDDPMVNEQIAADCLAQGIVVISSTKSDTPFHPMANRSWSGGLVAVSVPQAPSLAPELAAHLAGKAQSGYGRQAELMAQLRKAAQQALPPPQARGLMRQAAQMTSEQLEKIIAEMQKEQDAQ